MTHPKHFDKAVAAVVARIPKRAYPLMDYASRAGGSVFVITTLLVALLAALILHNTELLKHALLTLLFTPLAESLKFVTRRKRPETLYAQNMKFKTYSFPSGHSYASALTAGFIAVLAMTMLGGVAGWIIAAIAVLISALVGTSRVYLGAHFPSDVIAGWSLGAFITYLIIVLQRS